MEKVLALFLVLFLVLFGVLLGSFLIAIGIEYFCFCTKPTAGADEAQSEAQTQTQAELEVPVIPHQLQVPVIPHQLRVPKSRGTQPRSYHQLEVIPEFPYPTPKVKLFPAMQKGIRNKEEKVGGAGGVRVPSSYYQPSFNNQPQLPSPQAPQLDEDTVLGSDLGVDCSGADLGVDCSGVIVADCSGGVDYLDLNLNDMILYSDEESTSRAPAPQAPKPRAPKPRMKLFPATSYLKQEWAKEMVDVTSQLRLWALERAAEKRAAAERESALEAAAEREAALEAEWERQAEWDMEAEWERQAEWDMEAEWDVEAQEEGKVPQQPNEYDCGLFVIHMMRLFLEQAPERFQLDNIDMIVGCLPSTCFLNLIFGLIELRFRRSLILVILLNGGVFVP
ncbi:hypothetical protein POM88_042207 [Heracleum sosnowskyi]|uniref:Ubiquitin-like protease family profile domain-containing protein n=1 Tax=Heracleum sosnowskyi TaxID=360622 RepID=A0AAD8MAF8_9APIA|nr:hypothetical protein POM88_042207 [Heracleum sosnowskyi]